MKQSQYSGKSIRASRLILGIAAAVMTAGLAQAQTDSGGDILKTDKRLLAEERVQVDSERRLKSSVRRIAFLLEDLESNGLLGDDSQKLEFVKEVLKTVANQNVPRAKQSLRTARADLKKALPHISSAEKEIKTIIGLLDRALQGASAILNDDKLLKELNEIIKTEEFLKQQTTTWGKRLILNPDTAKGDQGRISRAQQSALKRYEDFFKALAKATKEADPESQKRFGAAEKLLREGKPDALLAKAADEIGVAKAVAAVSNQIKALKLLRAAQKILSADSSDLTDLLKDLEQIIAAQKKLKEDVTKANGGAFSRDQSKFETRQLDITNDIAAWVGIETLQDGPLEAPLRDAKQASIRARNFLKTGDKPKAIKAQEEVIKALEKALEIATAELAKEMMQEQPLDGNGLEGTEGTEGNEGDGNSDAFGAESFGESFGMAAAGGLPGAGTEGAGAGGEGEGAGMGMGMGGMGMGQGQGQGRGQGQPTPFQGDPKDLAESSSAGTSSTVAKGAKVARTRIARDILARRKRSAAIQKYVKQLPPEFRKQIAEYYEALAR